MKAGMGQEKFIEQKLLILRGSDCWTHSLGFQTSSEQSAPTETNGLKKYER